MGAALFLFLCRGNGKPLHVSLLMDYELTLSIA